MSKTKECIIHFRIDRLQIVGDERNLRGLLYLPEGQLPTVEDLLTCLKQCGFEDVRLRDQEKLLFEAGSAGDLVEIRIIQIGEKSEQATEPMLREIIRNQLKSDPIL